MRLPGLFRTLRMLAGGLLAMAFFLPLQSIPISWDAKTKPVHAWDLMHGDAAGALLLAAAFAAPAIVILLCGHRLWRGWSKLLLLASPALLGFSALVFFAIAQSAFTLMPVLFRWLMIPVDGAPGAGIMLALVADGVLLLLSCLYAARHLRVRT